MTVQPLKNEMAVVPMVSNQATPSKTSHLTSHTHQARPVPDGSSRNVAPQERLSGATIAPAKYAAMRFAAIHEDSIARSVKAVAQQTFTAVSVQMDAMKEALTHIVKNYPPFAMGDEKRVAYLMSITSIREQIQAMMLPHDRFSQPMVPEASQVRANKIWSDMFQGISLPTLTAAGPDEATDVQVQAALTSVTSMQTGLFERSAIVSQRTLPPLPAVSSPMAEFISNVTGQGLAITDFPLTTNLSGVLKSL